MAVQIGVSEATKAEIESYAKARDLSITAAADRLFAVAAGRLKALQKYAQKQVKEKLPTAPAPAPKAKAAKKITKALTEAVAAEKPTAKAPRVRKAKGAAHQEVEAPRPV